MESILTAIDEYRIILGAIVLTILAALLIRKYWDEVSFFILRIRMNMPVFGKIARLSNSGSREDSGWFSAEKSLCSEFQPYFQEVDKGPEFFDSCRSYLRKVTELGRSKLGFFGWVAIAVMVFIEAMGFSYVLAGFTIPGASEALKQQGAVGIALLISMLLVFMTHATGHELHHNKMVKKVRAWFRQSENGQHKAMMPNTEASLDNNEIDDNEPAWRQLLSRIDANHSVTPSYKVTVMTCIMVVLIALGATFVRGQVLESELAGAHDPVASSQSADPYADAIPAELRSSQDEVDSRVDETIKDATLKGGWGTFIVLAVIFIFLQIVGVLIGIKKGFAGSESAVAAKFTGKFKNREEFQVYQERKRNVVSQIAQRNLTKLQGKMAKKLSDTAIDTSTLKALESGNGRTFLAYAQTVRKDHSSDHVDSSKGRQARDDEMASIQKPQPTPEAPTQSAPKAADTSSQSSASNESQIPEATIQEWMDKLGWGREETVALLVKQQQKEQAKKPAVSQEEALRMLEAADK